MCVAVYIATSLPTAFSGLFFSFQVLVLSNSTQSSPLCLERILYEASQRVNKGRLPDVLSLDFQCLLREIFLS